MKLLALIMWLVLIASRGTLYAAEQFLIADPPYWVLRTMQVMGTLSLTGIIVIRFIRFIS